MSWGLTGGTSLSFLADLRVAMDPYAGPSIAPHINKPKMERDLGYNWKMPGFYDSKQYIHEGVNDALTNGYAGMDDRTWSNVRRHLDHVNEYSGGSEHPLGQEALRYQGRELASRAVHSEPTQEPLYRGMMLHPDAIAKIQPGQNVNFPASSFAPHKSTAMGYAGDERHSPWTDFDRNKYSPEHQGVVFQLEPGAKTARIPDMHGSTDEHAAFGDFEVTHVQPGKPMIDQPTGGGIQDKWINDTENPRNSGWTYKPILKSWHEPHVVTIRHKSLSPHAPEQHLARRRSL